jgi:Peptidase inhibitor I78 family
MHRRMVRCLAVVLPVCLLACGPAPIVNPKVPDAPVAPGLVHHEPDGCGMAGFLGLVGHPAADVARVIAARAELPRHRIVPFGSMIAQDYDAARLNFTLDAEGRVNGVRCG